MHQKHIKTWVKLRTQKKTLSQSSIPEKNLEPEQHFLCNMSLVLANIGIDVGKSHWSLLILTLLCENVSVYIQNTLATPYMYVQLLATVTSDTSWALLVFRFNHSHEGGLQLPDICV